MEIRSHARAVVIGGGIIGCSVLYHLAKLGLTDVLLLEKSELTAGSTWHAAGHVAFYADKLIHSRLQKESFDFYSALERDGRPVGQHACGSLRLALYADQLREFERFAGRARSLGIDHEIIGPSEVRNLCPILETKEIVGALYIPHDGFVDPNMTTQAVASAARELGASIARQTEVTNIQQQGNGEWRIETNRGSIACETIVNCAGFWAPQISAMLGFDLPVVAVEDEYLVTDRIEAVASHTGELPIVRELKTPFYMRQERDGLMISCYESKPVFWGLGGIPRDFGRELLPDDLERASATLERTMDFIPAFGGAGIKSVVNGPLGRTPDVVGLLGPAHGLRGYWVFCGEMAGFFRSSAARYLAQWIIAGEPDIDLSVLDVRRFDPRMGKDYAVERLNSGHVYSLPIYYPHVEPSGGRGFKTSPIYGRLQSRGAVFGERNGWEVPNWFSPDGAGATEKPSLEHANWFEPVAAECRAIQHRVGLIDLTSRAKFSVEGAGAAAWLDGLCANRLPLVGRVSRAPFLTAGGRVAASFTMARLADDRFYLTDWAVNEQRDQSWLEGASPISDIKVRNVTTDMAVIGVSGPMSREVLQSLFDHSPESGHLPLSPVSEITLAGIRVTVLKVDLTGELDYEIHCETSDQAGLYEALLEAGRVYGIVDFGFRALDSLRLEKGWFCSGIDYGMAAKPWNVGLSTWIDLDKGDFLGSVAYKKDLDTNGHSQPAALIIDTHGDCIAPWGEEPVLCAGKEIGFTTSGGYGHRIDKAVALASLPQPIPDDQPVTVELLGKSYRAQASAVPPYDPEGHRMRG